MLDLIGDIHGHADKLETLLQKLGYQQIDGVYSHPTRKVLFVGDYIDRGPKIRETLQIVKSMSDNGSAIALMGNHEYNALCFHAKDEAGGHLRKHSIKNIVQHYATLKAFHNKEDEYELYLQWFKTLPLFYENDSLRAVHACWDAAHIAYLRSVLVNDCLTDALLAESIVEDTPLFTAIEETLKGKEMQMPSGLFFHDKDDTKRQRIRIKWWQDPSQSTYKSISVIPIDSLPNTPISQAELSSTSFYPATAKKVFFGHYWLHGEPTPLTANVYCLDYSVAKGGVLVAYRLGDKKVLKTENFVWV